MVTERRELHPLFQTVNYLVKETRHNEQIAREMGETDLPDYLGPNSAEVLIRSLVRLTPNRIYFDGQSRVCRVLLFREKGLKHEAYMEIAEPAEQPSAQEWRPFKSQYFDGSSPRALEDELSFWRRRFNMHYNLLEQPTEVLGVLESDGRIGAEYIHLLRERQPIYYHYTLTDQGFLTLGLSLAENPYTGTSSRVVKGVPQTVIDYAHPF